MVLTVKPVELNPKTLEAFDAYIHNAETEMEKSVDGSVSFLWSQQAPERAQVVDQGQRWRNFGLAEGLPKFRMV